MWVKKRCGKHAAGLSARLGRGSVLLLLQRSTLRPLSTQSVQMLFVRRPCLVLSLRLRYRLFLLAPFPRNFEPLSRARHLLASFALISTLAVGFGACHKLKAPYVDQKLIFRL